MISSGSKPQAIIWDMDGVLVDNNEFHYQAWVEIYRHYSDNDQDLSRAEFEAVFGMRNAETVPRLFGAARATPSFIAQVSQAKEELFRQSIQGWLKPLPGAREWLGYWQTAGVKQAVASSAPKLNIEAILAEIEVPPFFEVMVSGEAPGVARSKPAPDIFLEAARQLGVAPAHCLVIEDAVVGVQAAKSAGMRCLAVMTSHSRADLAAADWVVEGLTDLSPDRLAALWPTL